MADEDPLDGLAEAIADAAPEAVWHERGPALDDQGHLDGALTCRSCGYNLHGLPPEGDCPECGLDVIGSAMGDRLQSADLGWLRSVRLGLSVYFAALFVSHIASLLELLFILILASPDLHLHPSGSGKSSVLPVANGLIALRLSIAGAMFVGVWKLTSPDPDHQFEPAFASRKLFRWGKCISFVLMVMATATMFLRGIVTPIILLIAIFPAGVSFFAMFVYLRGLALRLPARRLASRTRLVMWGLAGCIAVPVLLVGFLMLLEALLPVGVNPPLIDTLVKLLLGVITFCLFVFVVFTILWFFTLFNYQSRLNKAYQMARRERRHRPQARA